MPYYLGIDGGGTKTEALILHESGHVLGIGTAGSSNFNNIGIGQAQHHIHDAIANAKLEANLEIDQFDAAFLGIAGAVSREDRAIISKMAQDLQLAAEDKVGVDHDCRIALAGGLGGDAGIVQIIGTGTSCFGLDSKGERWLAGGWGYLIADEGGGYWLGIEALKATTAAYDTRGQATILQEMIMDALEISNVQQIMQRVYTEQLSIADIAALARFVIDAAHKHDTVALDIIQRGMDEVAICIEAVAKKLNFDADDKITYVGGLTQAGAIILEPLQQAIHKRLPDREIVPPILSPSCGAGLLACQIDHISITSEFIHMIQQTSIERH